MRILLIAVPRFLYYDEIVLSIVMSHESLDRVAVLLLEYHLLWLGYPWDLVTL